MARDTGGQSPVEILDGMAGKVHRGLFRAQNGFFMLHGALQALREAVQAPGDHQRRDIVEEQVVKALAPLLLRQAFEICHLRLADHLQAAGIKVIIKVMELQSGTVHIRDGQQRRLVVAAPVEYFKTEKRDKICDLQAFFIHRASFTFPAQRRPLLPLGQRERPAGRLKNIKAETAFYYI